MSIENPGCWSYKKIVYIKAKPALIKQAINTNTNSNTYKSFEKIL